MYLNKVFIICLFGLSSIFASAEDKINYIEGDLIQGPYKTDIIEGCELSVINTSDTEFPLSLF